MAGVGLSSKLLKNLGANAFGQLITVAIQLISVPLFIKYWGVEMYGEWLILSAIPSYLAMSDIGFASVAANDMTMRVARNDRNGALQVYQSVWIFICVVTVFFGSVLGVFILLYPITDLFSIKNISQDQVQKILIILMLYVFAGLQVGILNAGFRAVSRYAYSVVLNNIIRLMEWLLSVFMLIQFNDVVYVALAILIVRCLGVVFMGMRLHMQAPWLRLGIRKASTMQIRELLGPAIAFMAFPLGLAISLQGMVIVIGMTLGSAPVAIFSAYRTLTRLVVQIMTMLNQSIWPEISSAYGAGNMKLVSKMHRRGSSVVFWITIPSMFAIWLVGDWIIAFWTHHSFEPNSDLLALLLATTFLNVLWQTSWVVLMATNNHPGISIVFVVSAASGLVISYLIIPVFGLNGAGLTLILSEIPMLFFSVKKVLNLVNEGWLNYMRNVISNPFIKMVDI